MKRSLKLLPLAAATMLTAGTASANPTLAIEGFDAETRILSGTAAFPSLGEQSVVVYEDTITGFQPTGADDVPPDVIAALGLDLVDATITPLPDASGLRFTWVLGSPIEMVPPEGLRYNWSFSVGGQAYQLQAKTTNLVSTTTVDAPQAHAEQLAAGKGFFQIRGRCTTSYMGTPAAGCVHLGFLEGDIDEAAGRVSIDLPYGTAMAPDVVYGATIVEALSANMSIAASLQAAVSNTTTSAYINGWGQYVTAPQLQANEVAVGNDPVFAPYDDTLTLAEDGTFSGVVDGSGGLILARACHGVTCVYDSLEL